MTAITLPHWPAIPVVLPHRWWLVLAVLWVVAGAWTYALTLTSHWDFVAIAWRHRRRDMVCAILYAIIAPVGLLTAVFATLEHGRLPSWSQLRWRRATLDECRAAFTAKWPDLDFDVYIATNTVVAKKT